MADLHAGQRRLPRTQAESLCDGLAAVVAPIDAVRGEQLAQRQLVSHVLAGGAAEAAGVSARDEILGCNSWRLRRLDDAPGLLAAGDTRLRLLISRDQRLVELEVDLPPAGPASVALTLADGAQATRRRWLGA